MEYRIEFSSKAKKSIKKLDKKELNIILGKFEEVRKDPFRYLKHYEGLGYKLRIGEYRSIIDIDFKKEILKIRIFDKRGRVYKN